MKSADRRILLTAYPPDSGVARHMIEVAEGALRAGWLVHLACPRESEQWHALAGRPGVTPVALRGSHGPPRMRDLAALPQLVRLVRGASVVHAHASKAGFLTRLAAAITGRRQRTIFSPHAWSFWAAAGVRGRLYLHLERVAARWCRTIVAVSAAEMQAGLRAGVGRPEDYEVILNGVDVARFEAPQAPVAGRILFVGRLAAQKRPDLAVRAFARVHARHPSARLDLVGEGPLQRETEQLVASLGVEAFVRFLGTRADVPELLARAHCLLLTSDYESCPLTVLEAMAAGVPVVSTAVGGVSELVTDETGLLVPRGDLAATARALESLLADGRLAARLGAAGREVARARFSSSRMVDETVDLYSRTAAA